jgi:MoxR-like ATPase
MSRTAGMPSSVEETLALLTGERYLADRDLAVLVFLALKLRRPIFLEGEPGVGKTEIAKVLAAGLGRELIRLQCYEGLDANAAVYEWNYLRQILELRLAEATHAQDSRDELAAEIFGERFLIKRPLLRALEAHASGPPVLLIDEVDRADEPFEAFLLEILSDFQVSIPEFGVLRAAEPPIVVLTSNRTREVHDALKRRCLYHWVGYPDAVRELMILKARVPEANAELGAAIVKYVQNLRRRNLYKAPGVAEALDWARAILALGAHALTPDLAADTLGVLLKYEEDVGTARAGIAADFAPPAH